MATSVLDIFEKAKAMSLDQTIVLSFKEQSKLLSFKAAFYKLKKENENFDLFLSVKRLSLTIYKKSFDNNNEDDFSVSFESTEKSSTTKDDKSGIPQTNIDGDRIKTIREKLSLFDKEKATLAEQFKTCKDEIESLEELSVEDKEFLIEKSLEITNLAINRLNKKAKELALEFKKSQ